MKPRLLRWSKLTSFFGMFNEVIYLWYWLREDFLDYRWFCHMLRRTYLMYTVSCVWFISWGFICCCWLMLWLVDCVVDIWLLTCCCFQLFLSGKGRFRLVVVWLIDLFGLLSIFFWLIWLFYWILHALVYIADMRSPVAWWNPGGN